MAKKKKAVKKENSGKYKSKVKLKKPKRKPSMKDINEKLDKVLSVEQNLLTEEKTIEKEEENTAKEEKNIEKKEEKISKEEKVLEKIEDKTEKDESKEENEIEKLERMEKEIKKDVGEHPLARITGKDIMKGLVGSFVGLAVHYTFTYGVEISQKLDMVRATLLFPFSFAVGLLFIYATGFRKIKDPKILMFMPLRLIVLYLSAILMSIAVLFIFYPTFGQNFIESYKMVAGVLLAAIVGACTADLIGKD